MYAGQKGEENSTFMVMCEIKIKVACIHFRSPKVKKDDMHYGLIKAYIHLKNAA